MGILDKVLRAGEGKKLKALQSLVPDINALEPEYERLSDEDLARKTIEFRQQIDQARKAGESDDDILNDLLLDAFATTREASRRIIGQRHYDVQMMGGAALHFGWIAEMKTGEGKTLVSTLPVYLNALGGNGVHVITVNDYLARFQGEWMGRIFKFLGLEVGFVLPQIEGWQNKKIAYDADVTYGTNTEFGFDYLRDNMVRAKDHMVQRGHNYAIVDEIDSILIDEARTPLIISMPSSETAKLYQQFAGIARRLVRDNDYEVNEEKRQVVVTEEGIETVEKILGVDNLYDVVQAQYVHQLQQALRAKELYKRDKEYVVMDGEVKIVDEHTGRILDGRRWSEGLHQAVEAKEGVRVKEENHTRATVTLQNYFRMYNKLAGMTGTALTEAAEFANTYGLQVVPIPTNKPMVRQDHGDLIYKTEPAKFDAVIADVEERNGRGQPILIGTASVEKSEVLSRMMEKRGISHTVLNAKQHAREAEIIAQAGRMYSVTVATNMAGRGVDILLGGNPEGLAARDTRAEGLELESDEGRARYLDLLAKYEQECKAEGDKIRELGGLYVIGSERHESRRIDNQLRGRAGRQGDPGESRFYLSLEDELMRYFATGAMNWVMGKALPDDVPIEAKMVTKAIERAQTTVEGRNAEIRKDVLKYDEVMNQQRKVIYGRRMQVLDGEDLRSLTMDLVHDAIAGAVDTFCAGDHPEDWDIEGLHGEIHTYYPTKFTVEELREAHDEEQLIESLANEAESYYEGREQAMPNGPETMRELERRIMLSIIDQKWVEHLSEMDYLREGINLRAMGQKDPLVEWQREGYDMFTRMMEAIDDDYVKYVMHVEVVVEQPKDPDLSGATYEGAEQAPQGAAAIRQAAESQPAEAAQAAPAAPGQPRQVAQADEPQAPIVKSEQEKLGRNQPCWCGSGKKFKLCHGR